MINRMRSLLLLIPAALMLTAQTPPPSVRKTTPEHKPAPLAAAKNFKLSGSPSAPITLEIYTDYECPMCGTLYKDLLPPLEAQYVATGKIQILHRDFPLTMHAYSRIAAKYANAAGQIGRYELVANQIFKTQSDWSQNGNVDATVAKVLPPGEMQKVRDLVKNDAHLDDTVTVDLAKGAQDNLNQTPTMIIVNKGKRQKIDGMVPFGILKSYLDQILAKAKGQHQMSRNRTLRQGLLLLGRLVLAGIFLAAGYLKLREPWLQFAVSINSLKILPDNMLEPVARTLPWGELVLGLLILSGLWLRWSAAIASLLLGIFLTVLVRSYAIGLQVDCGCFGSGEPLGPKTLARDAAMLALSLAVTVAAFRMRKPFSAPSEPIG